MDGVGLVLKGINEDNKEVIFNLDGITTPTSGKFILESEYEEIIKKSQSLTLMVLVDGQQVGESITINK